MTANVSKTNPEAIRADCDPEGLWRDRAREKPRRQFSQRSYYVRRLVIVILILTVVITVCRATSEWRVRKYTGFDGVTRLSEVPESERPDGISCTGTKPEPDEFLRAIDTSDNPENTAWQTYAVSECWQNEVDEFTLPGNYTVTSSQHCFHAWADQNGVAYEFLQFDGTWLITTTAKYDSRKGYYLGRYCRTKRSYKICDSRAVSKILCNVDDPGFMTSSQDCTTAEWLDIISTGSAREAAEFRTSECDC